MNIEEKIWLYTEGELSAEEHERVAVLIESDEDYKTAYTTYLSIENELKSSPLLHPSSHFVENTMREIEHFSVEKKSVNALVQHGLSIAAILIFSGLFLASKSFSGADIMPHFDLNMNFSPTSYIYIALTMVGVLWTITESEVDFI